MTINTEYRCRHCGRPLCELCDTGGRRLHALARECSGCKLRLNTDVDGGLFTEAHWTELFG